MTPALSPERKDKQKSFRLDDRDFLETRKVMYGVWKVLFYCLAFIITWLVAMDEKNIWLMVCIALGWLSSLELMEFKIKKMYEQSSK